MKDAKPAGISPALRWICFLVLLAVAIGWAAESVLARSRRMKTAGTSAQAFLRAAAGTNIKVVARIDMVSDEDLKTTPLERVSDSVYRKSHVSGSSIAAVLTPGTSVVMGKAQDIVPGAIVQLAGTIEGNHVLHTSQVVILTGYVHVAEDSR